MIAFHGGWWRLSRLTNPQIIVNSNSMKWTALCCTRPFSVLVHWCLSALFLGHGPAVVDSTTARHALFMLMHDFSYSATANKFKMTLARPPASRFQPQELRSVLTGLALCSQSCDWDQRWHWKCVVAPPLEIQDYLALAIQVCPTQVWQTVQIWKCSVSDLFGRCKTNLSGPSQTSAHSKDK